MISMPKVQSIRRRRMNGESIASIARSENAGGADGAQVPEGGGFVSQAAGQAGNTRSRSSTVTCR